MTGYGVIMRSCLPRLILCNINQKTHYLGRGAAVQLRKSASNVAGNSMVVGLGRAFYDCAPACVFSGGLHAKRMKTRNSILKELKICVNVFVEGGGGGGGRARVGCIVKMSC